jgi:CheY-like chemotaxis protein
LPGPVKDGKGLEMRDLVELAGRTHDRRPGAGTQEAVAPRDGSTVSVRAAPSGARKKPRGASSRPSQPVLLAVDDDPRSLGKTGRELRKRYGEDYRIVCEGSAEAGMRRLRELKAADEEVAVVLADQWMPGMSGTEFLGRVRRLYPTAKRALLIAWGDKTAQEPILRSMSLGLID